MLFTVMLQIIKVNMKPNNKMNFRDYLKQKNMHM